MAQQGHNWNGNIGDTSWPSWIGPLLVSFVLPLLRFGVQQLMDWYARRVTGRLYRAGLMRDRRGSRPNTYRTHKKGE